MSGPVVPEPGADAGQDAEAVHVPDLPPVLQDVVAVLEDWAARNNDDARKDALKFWALKIPAITVSASAGLLAHFNVEVGVGAGVVTSVCVLLDGILRAGTLRAVHLRAVSDIKALKHDVYAKWRASYLRGSEPEKLRESTAKIIEFSEKEKKKIAQYLQNAETALPSSGRRRSG